MEPISFILGLLIGTILLIVITFMVLTPVVAFLSSRKRRRTRSVRH